MPVRKIKPSYTVVTGAVSSQKNDNLSEFEGPLEWQYLIILEFDWENKIESFEVQPLKILYGKTLRGRQRCYTPDILVHYLDGRPPNLIEVKPRRYLHKNWKDLKPKLRAGIRYARQHGMRFKIITDKEIFTPFLDNARFLRQFKFLDSSAEDSTLLVHALSRTKQTTPKELLNSIASDIWQQATLIPSLWHLVANRRIGIDINRKIHMESPIWPLSEV